MSIHITSPLQKNLPSLATEANDQEWQRALSQFLENSESHIRPLILTLETNLDILAHQKLRCGEIIALLEEAGGLTVRARNILNPTISLTLGSTPSSPMDEKTIHQLKEFESWFLRALEKLDTAVAESYIHDTNLLNGGSLITALDEKGTNSLVTQGFSLTSEALGIRKPDFSTLFSIQNARIDVMNAMDMAVTLRNIISAQEITLAISRDFALQTLEMAESAKANIPQTSPLAEPSALKLLHAKASTLFGDEPLAEPPQHEIFQNFASSPTMEDI